ncbi:guanylate kinase [Urbifossiella limnaea]|uniref:Guanylate kinase n=1 Tax=Urbifossiella limnaea TaxID=2528023 RepID=A0A517XY25_9BACT|nr:guanylate kinase [Urbifossiella limnaea]QDU22412.1 Guanylate kinase [Urbifossiella limnaea]
MTTPTGRTAPLIVLSGPSGVGKTTLVDGLIGRNVLPLRRAITATTRKRRPGELDGVSYHYWTHDQFREAIARGEMLEWAEVHGVDFYGTPRAEVDPYRAAGVGVILVIDVQGAGQVRLLYPGDHLSLFVMPPAFDVLRHRLDGRGEPEASIHRRLETARGELARADEFDKRLENADLTAATDALERLIRDEFTRRGF